MPFSSGNPRTNIDLNIKKLTVLYKSTTNPRILYCDRITSYDAVLLDSVIDN